MRRRDVSKALLLTSASGAVVFTEKTQAQTCTAPCYAVISGEVTANVFQTKYPPGDIRRYYNPAAAPAGDAGDWTNALNRLRAVGVNGIACFIPAGTYPYLGTSTAYPNPINWAVDNLQLTGERGTILQYTGKDVGFNIDSGGNGARKGGLLISNIIIQGNATASGGSTYMTDGLQLRGISHSIFRNIEVRNCTGKAFNIRWGVANQFEHCFFSRNVYDSDPKPAYGFFLDDDHDEHHSFTGNYTTTQTFTNCAAEAFPGIGLELFNASGNTFIGCNFEALTIGVSVDSACFRNRFINVWFEANSRTDAWVYGVGNSFCSCNFGSYQSSSPTISVITGQATAFESCFVPHIELQSSSKDTLFVGTMFSVGAITGSGPYKMVGGTQVDSTGHVTASLPNVP